MLTLVKKPNFFEKKVLSMDKYCGNVNTKSLFVNNENFGKTFCLVILLKIVWEFLYKTHKNRGSRLDFIDTVVKVC